MSDFPDEPRYSAPELFRSRLRDELLESADVALEAGAQGRVDQAVPLSLEPEPEHQRSRVGWLLVPVAACILIVVGIALSTRESNDRQTIAATEPVSACVGVAQSINALSSSTDLADVRLDALVGALGEFFDQLTLDPSANADDVAALGRAVGAVAELQLDFGLGDTAGSLRALEEVDHQLKALSSGVLFTTREGFSCP